MTWLLLPTLATLLAVEPSAAAGSSAPEPSWYGGPAVDDAVLSWSAPRVVPSVAVGDGRAFLGLGGAF